MRLSPIKMWSELGLKTPLLRVTIFVRQVKYEMILLHHTYTQVDFFYVIYQNALHSDSSDYWGRYNNNSYNSNNSYNNNNNSYNNNNNNINFTLCIRFGKEV